MTNQNQAFLRAMKHVELKLEYAACFLGGFIAFNTLDKGQQMPQIPY